MCRCGEPGGVEYSSAQLSSAQPRPAHFISAQSRASQPSTAQTNSGQLRSTQRSQAQRSLANAAQPNPAQHSHGRAPNDNDIARYFGRAPSFDMVCGLARAPATIRYDIWRGPGWRYDISRPRGRTIFDDILVSLPHGPHGCLGLDARHFLERAAVCRGLVLESLTSDLVVGTFFIF